MNNKTPEAQKVEFLARAQDALTAVFDSGSHGPFFAEVIINAAERLAERPGSKVRSAATFILLEAPNGDQKDYATMAAFSGNPVFLAAIMQHGNNAYQMQAQREQKRGMLADLFKRMKDEHGPEDEEGGHPHDCAAEDCEMRDQPFKGSADPGAEG